jgi:hypothetical protein
MYRTADTAIWEFPMSTTKFLGFNLPIAGGNYLRQFPHPFMLRQFRKWQRNTDSPFVLYFHPWELDDSQPVVSSFSYVKKLRQYRNLGKIASYLPDYFRAAEFVSVAQYLGETLSYPKIGRCTQPRGKGMTSDSCGDGTKNPKRRITVVVPCFNEVTSIPYLARSLDEFLTEADKLYRVNLIFVDDGSSDKTYKALQERFGRQDNTRIIRHPVNRGIAAAIRTGINKAETEIVCSMDADCSYDPLDLLHMIPELRKGCDVVTASPYHIKGAVKGVSEWRLFLSRTLSRIYQVIFANKLQTYTSCFRVYRRSAVLNNLNRFDDFRGIVELLARVDTCGGKIGEFPSSLQNRIFGYSKMKIAKTIFAHILLLGRILAMKKGRSGTT